MADNDSSAGFVIPTIDIAPFLADPTSTASAAVVEAVREAAMTTGFFSLVGHGVPTALQQEVLRAARRLFALPAEEKKRLVPAGGKPLGRGYELIGAQVLQAGTLPDLKEGFYIGRHVAASDERARRHPHFVGENLFPAGVPAAEMQQPAEAYYDAVLGLAQAVLAVLARGLPYGDDVFADFASRDPLCTLRLLHYPPASSGDARQLGAGAHTDFGAITLLLQDSAGGLEVQDPATGGFVPVPPDPAAYVVNVGDMLALWTRGAYRSAVHRVVNKGAGDRYSVPFFFDGNLDVRLAPLDGGAGPALTVEEHMLERFATTYAKREEGEAVI